MSNADPVCVLVFYFTIHDDIHFCESEYFTKTFYVKNFTNFSQLLDNF